MYVSYDCYAKGAECCQNYHNYSIDELSQIDREHQRAMGHTVHDDGDCEEEDTIYCRRQPIGDDDDWRSWRREDRDPDDELFEMDHALVAAHHPSGKGRGQGITGSSTIATKEHVEPPEGLPSVVGWHIDKQKKIILVTKGSEAFQLPNTAIDSPNALIKARGIEVPRYRSTWILEASGNWAMVENSVDFTQLVKADDWLNVVSDTLITRFSTDYRPSLHGYDFRIDYEDNVDFIELFAGSAHMSKAHCDEGMSVGFPMDIRMGYDLNSKRGQAMAWEQIWLQEPSLVLVIHH